MTCNDMQWHQQVLEFPCVKSCCIYGSVSTRLNSEWLYSYTVYIQYVHKAKWKKSGSSLHASSLQFFIILHTLSSLFFLSKWLCTLCTEMYRMLKTLFLLFQRVPLLFLNGSRRWQNVPLHAECLRYSIRCKRLGDSGDVTTSVTVLQQQSATVILIATDSNW